MVRDLLIVREKSEDFHECLRFLEKQDIRVGLNNYKHSNIRFCCFLGLIISPTS